MDSVSTAGTKRVPAAKPCRRAGSRKAALSVPACREKVQAPQRRRSSTGASHAQRCFLTSDTVEELIKASQLVPGVRTEQATHSVVGFYQEMPTSFTNQENMGAGKAEQTSWDVVWPSLREAASGGWDFCSDASDDEREEEPVVQDKAMNASWCFVPTAGLSCPLESKAKIPCSKDGEAKSVRKTSFAEVLRAGSPSSALPPASGTRVPTAIVRASPVRRGAATRSGRDDSEDDMQPEDSLRDNRSHGWKKQHKASWSTKLQRKVAYATAKRAGQSCNSRGWMENDAE
jgi:hypothetical protein